MDLIWNFRAVWMETYGYRALKNHWLPLLLRSRRRHKASTKPLFLICLNSIGHWLERGLGSNAPTIGELVGFKDEERLC